MIANHVSRMMFPELDLNPIKVKLMHESGEAWSVQKVDAVEVEYRRFLYLMKKYPEEQTAPLVEVDIFWHYHILDTMKYAADCDIVFGHFLHHYPYLGMNGDDDESVREQAGQRMRQLYEDTFGGTDEASGAAGTAWCGITSAARREATAWCGISSDKDDFKVAWCGISAQADTENLAWCGVATKPASGTASPNSGAAMPGSAELAWCGIAAKPATGKLAWCGIAAKPATGKLAWCGNTAKPGAAKLAWCGIAAKPSAEKLAWCGVSPADVRAEQPAPPAAGRPVHEVADNRAERPHGKLAWCGITQRSHAVNSWCGAGVTNAATATTSAPRDSSDERERNSDVPCLIAA